MEKLFERHGWVRRVLISCLVLFLWAGSLNAEPHWDWGKTFGGLWNEEVFSLQVTQDDGFIMAGRTKTFVMTPGYEDAWVLKLEAHGQVEWEKTYGGALWDRIDDVRQVEDGGYVTAGNRVAPGGSQDVWIMKLTPEGQVAWEQTYGRDLYYDGASDIEQTADGGFIVLGWTKSYALNVEQGAWVFKLSEDGEIEWQRFLGGSRYDQLFSIEQTADGGYILAGGTYSFTAAPHLYSDVWVVKLTHDGNVAWQKTYGGAGDEVAYAIRQTSGGGYFLACWTSSFHQGFGDVWVVKLDSQGDVIWQKSFGGVYGDVPFDLQVTSDHGAIVAGYTASFGGGRYDGWVVKLSQKGRIKWQKTFGGAATDTFHAIQETRWGYVAAGKTQSFGAGEEDAWAVGLSREGLLLGSSIEMDSTALAVETDATWGSVDGYSGAVAGTAFPSEVVVTDTYSEQGSLVRSPPGTASSLPQREAERLTRVVRWPRSAAEDWP